MKLSVYLKAIAPLSLKQYGLLRDAGWEHTELQNLDNFSYQRIRAEAQYDSSSGPAKPKQFEHLKRRCLEIDIVEPTYGMLRSVIRDIAKHEKSDELYLQYIAAAEAENQKRKQRRENAKTRAQT